VIHALILFYDLIVLLDYNCTGFVEIYTFIEFDLDQFIIPFFEPVETQAPHEQLILFVKSPKLLYQLANSYSGIPVHISSSFSA